MKSSKSRRDDGMKNEERGEKSSSKKKFSTGSSKDDSGKSEAPRRITAPGSFKEYRENRSKDAISKRGFVKKSASRPSSEDSSSDQEPAERANTVRPVVSGFRKLPGVKTGTFSRSGVKTGNPNSTGYKGAFSERESTSFRGTRDDSKTAPRRSSADTRAPYKGSSSESSYKTFKTDRPEKPYRSEGSGKTYRSESAEKPYRSEGAEKPYRSEGAEKPFKSGRPAKAHYKTDSRPERRELIDTEPDRPRSGAKPGPRERNAAAGTKPGFKERERERNEDTRSKPGFRESDKSRTGKQNIRERNDETRSRPALRERESDKPKFERTSFRDRNDEASSKPRETGTGKPAFAGKADARPARRLAADFGENETAARSVTKGSLTRGRPFDKAVKPVRNTKVEQAGERYNKGVIKPAAGVRLNKYIANSGLCARRKADEMISNGEIRVNGQEITEMGYIVQPGDKVQFHDTILKAEENVYILMNKPKDYITTTDDPQERHTVMELLNGATPHRIYPVGRLDRNTTGLLLFTNDGALAEKLSHPSSNINKLYHATLDKALTKVDFDKITEGVELEDGPISVDELAYVDGMSKKEVGIRIHSGKNRIVRRIFESFGYEVIKLDRVIYAGLTKKDLTRGRWRNLSAKEIISLKHFTK